MIKKSFFILLVSLLIGSVILQAKQTIRIIPYEGERWWGCMVALGSRMPFASELQYINLATENWNNQNVPLLLSSHGRYIWSEEPFSIQIQHGVIELTTKDSVLTPIKAGETLRDAYLAASKNHFPSSGQLPDELFFSMPQYNTWIELTYNQNQADILTYAENVKKHNFPVGVFMIDDSWNKYYGNFEFKPEKFPDPQAMIDKIHNDGFKIMLWVCPFVSADSPEFRELESKNYLIRSKSTGGAAIIRWWNGYSACYDLTNPDAIAHLVGKLKESQKIFGIDGYKFDAGDIGHYANADLVYYDKDATSVELSEAWARIGLEFPFNEYRAGWKMGGQPLVQRLGDKNYSWNAIELLIPDMISAGLLGYSYTCPDMIGGGQIASFINIDQTKLDQELIVRSCQVHALMPMMQFSVAPWRILDNKHLDIVSHYARLHEKFGDYILECAKESAVSGEPILRSMEYCYPHQGFVECRDQFMLGDKYLVAPMVKPGYKRSVTLPKGVWKDDKGEIIKVRKGVETIEIEVPIERLPYYTLIKDL